jgi:hypothetical protein
MGKTVTIAAGIDDLVSLPNGFAYEAGESVRLTDEEYDKLDPDVFGTLLTSAEGGISSVGNSNLKQVAIPIDLADLANSDVFTVHPGFAGSVVGVRYVPTTPSTTAAKAATLTTRINTTAVTGGVMKLNSVNAGTAGVSVGGGRITALNHFGETDDITVIVSGVTAFSEGKGYVLLDLVPSTTAVASSVEYLGANIAVVRTGIIPLASIADGDVLTLTPGVVGTITHVRAIVTTAASTASKLTTLNLEIGSTNLTGGTVALTTVLAAAAGNVIDNTADPSAANVLAAADVVTLEASSTTAFVEGAVIVEFVVLLS